jgi:hypothetical protein
VSRLKVVLKQKKFKPSRPEDERFCSGLLRLLASKQGLPTQDGIGELKNEINGMNELLLSWFSSRISFYILLQRWLLNLLDWARTTLPAPNPNTSIRIIELPNPKNNSSHPRTLISFD